MDIVKTATDWAKAEALSASLFILAGVLLLLACLGFWQLGRTELARAYIVPTLVAGSLLLIIGLGILIPSISRLSSFPALFANDAPALLSTELARADKVLNQYQIAVFRVIPAIIILCAALILFIDTPQWRAGLVTTLLMMGIIMMIDTNANERLKVYKQQLVAAAERQGG